MKGGKKMDASIAEMVSTGLTSLITDATGMVTTAAPAIIGVVGTFVGVNLGIKVFKRLANKIG